MEIAYSMSAVKTNAMQTVIQTLIAITYEAFTSELCCCCDISANRAVTTCKLNKDTADDHCYVKIILTRVILAGYAVTGIQKLTNEETTINILGIYFLTK